MKTTYTVKTRSGFRNLTNKQEALRIAKIEKSDGWPTFVKAGDKVIFSFERAPQPGLV
jgi:Tol biopolymer transport system component